MIITIDGPAGAGKTTLAGKIAQSLNIAHVDTGAMYRCVTFGVLKYHVNIHDPAILDRFLKNLKIETRDEENERHYFVDGEDVTKEIRLREITFFVTTVAAIPAIREYLVELQRSLAQKGGTVFEGRDMGTVVFPEAPLKFFLVANPEIRAKRRYKEMKAKYPEDFEELTLEQTFEEITDRDDIDMHRSIAPLKIAPNAIVINTSDLSIGQVLEKMMEYQPNRE